MIKDINKQIEEEAKNIAKRIVVIENRDKFSSETDMRVAEYCLYKAIKEQRESSSWRKVSEELPNDNIDVLVKIDIQGYIHYDVDRIIYGEWCNGDDGIIEWKPID